MGLSWRSDTRVPQHVSRYSCTRVVCLCARSMVRLPPWRHVARVALLTPGLILPSLSEAQSPLAADSVPVIDLAGTDASGNVRFGNVVGASRLSNGVIAIADGAAGEIRFLGSDGRVLRIVGRSGRGPGEFHRLSWLAQCGDDSLYAWDLTLRRLTIVDGKRMAVASDQLTPEAQPRSPIPAYLSCSRTGLLAFVGRPANPDVNGTGSQFERVSAGLVVGHIGGGHFTTLRTVQVGEIARASGSWYPRPLGRTTVLAVSSTRLFVGTGDSAAVDVYSLDGTHLRTIRVSSPPRAPDTTHVNRATAQLTAYLSGDIRERFRSTLRSIPAPRHLAPYSALLADGNDNLWVVVSVAGDRETRLQRYSTQGDGFTEIRIPRDMTVLEVGRDHVLGLYEEEDGEQHIVMYRLRAPR